MSGAVPEAAPQRRCGEPERPRGGCRLCPRRCREPGRRRGIQARRGHGEPPRRRAGDEGRRAWAPARHCSLQQGAGEAARCPGASGTRGPGPEGRRARAPLQGAGIWVRASAARRLGAQPVGTTRTVGRTELRLLGLFLHGPMQCISTMGRAEVWREPHLATLGPPPLEFIEVHSHVR